MKVGHRQAPNALNAQSSDWAFFALWVSVSWLKLRIELMRLALTDGCEKIGSFTVVLGKATEFVNTYFKACLQIH